MLVDGTFAVRSVLPHSDWRGLRVTEIECMSECRICISGETRWVPPIEAIIDMSSIFPDLLFAVVYEDDRITFGGVVVV